MLVIVTVLKANEGVENMFIPVMAGITFTMKNLMLLKFFQKTINPTNIPIPASPKP